MEKKGTSWGWIIFWCIVFCPIGLILLFYKLAKDKSALMTGNTKTLYSVAVFMLILGVLYTISIALAFFGIMNIVGAVVLFIKANSTKKTVEKYKALINMIANYNVRSIDEMARATKSSYEETVRDLQSMISIGLLWGAHIDHMSRMLVIQRYVPVDQTVVVQAQAHQAPRETTVSCSGCGANNIVIVGRVTICEYCGTPVSAS